MTAPAAPTGSLRAVASRIERLLNLLNVLIGAERPVSAARIRAMVPGYPAEQASFHRQFERDKAELRDMGLPLAAETVPGTYPEEVGYRIPREEAYLRDPGLEPEELAALHLAASAIRLEGIEGSGGLWKLGGAPEGPDGAGAAAARNGAAGVADLPADDRLVTLFRAVAQRRQMRFTYGEVPRRLDPYRLDCARGRWYVTGHDHTRNATRHFRLDRVDGAVEVGEVGAFERPAARVPGVRMEPWRFASTEPVTARVLIDADHVPTATQVAPSATVVEERADGAVVLELEVSDLDGFRSFVLGFLEHAEVLDPPELRDEVVGWLTSVAEAGP